MNQQHHLEQIVYHFLQLHLDAQRPLLLALSGGPDSLALFYLLLKYREKNPLTLAVAHVDHGWREESREEAEKLCQLAKEHQVAFHLKKLIPPSREGNLEAICRNERLEFFSSLCREQGYQAVMLAHHADDQAETVLKRVLEGADLPFCAGLQEENEINGIKLWRPLLEVKKGELEKYLSGYGVEPFFDRTNLDSRFLRGRFRTNIIPFLVTAFGKEVTQSLCHIGKEAQELKLYLKDSCAHYLDVVVHGVFGEYIDFTHEFPKHPFEMRYVIREICRQNQFVLSRELVDSAYEMLTANKADKQIEVAHHKIIIDRKKMFIVDESKLTVLPEAVILQKQMKYGIWNVAVESVKEKLEAITGWEQVWKGHVEICLPEGKYQIGPVDLHAPYPGDHATINKWWTNKKVPAFLRHHVPVIMDDAGRVCHEFLSGRTNREETTGNWVRIKLERK